MVLPSVGGTFHGYVLEAELGSGGFSTVYRAVEVATGAVFALKVLHPDAADGDYSPRRVQRFNREVEVLSVLNSPGIVQLYNWGQTPDGLLYMMFELIEGADLADWMKHGPMPVPLVRTILGQMLDALAAAHEAGVLHRDIKPDNIRVWDDNGIRTKLLDFGIARPLKLAGPALTATGELVGTVRFLAPELLRGEEPSAVSDLYSLGLVAYEMVTGEHSARRRMAQGTPLRLERAQVPDENLRRTINHMLRDDPSERPQSARAACHALNQAPAQRSATLLEIRPERPRWHGPAVGGLVTAAVMAIAGWFLIQREPEPSPQPVVRPAVLRPSLPDTPVKHEEPVENPEEPLARDGCGLEPPFVGQGRLGALDGMTVREVVTHIPPSYDPNRRHPLIVLLHQWGDDAGQFLDATRLKPLADEERFIVIAPQDGPMYPWADAADMDDVKWAVELARTDLCIDDRRIYGLGNGDGGMIVERMPCELEVAAIATTAFRGRSDQIECDWGKTSPVPYLMITGTKDGYNPIDGGRGCDDVKISLADKERTWRDRYGCGKGHDITPIKTSECRTFRDCARPLTSCRADGGHQWPHAPERDNDWKNCDGIAADFPYRDTIWNFFDARALEP